MGLMAVIAFIPFITFLPAEIGKTILVDIELELAVLLPLEGCTWKLAWTPALQLHVLQFFPPHLKQLLVRCLLVWLLAGSFCACLSKTSNLSLQLDGSWQTESC